MTDLALSSRLALAIKCLEAAARWDDETYMRFEDRAASLEAGGLNKAEAEIKAFVEIRAQRRAASAGFPR